MEINEYLLNKFFMDEASPQEIAAIRDWATASEANGEQFRKAFDLYSATTVALARMNGMPEVSRVLSRRRRARAYAAVAFACLMLGIVIQRQLVTKPLRAEREQMLSAVTSMSTTPGQRVDLTLPDGSRVSLNSASTLEYRSLLAGDERVVKLDGEALFEVAKDAAHPFVVRTHACDVRVTGTRFNVRADEAAGEFEAALLSGGIVLAMGDGRAPISLQPGQEAVLEEGAMHLRKIEDPDNVDLWASGVISVAGVPFDRLMRTFERCYGVQIVIRRSDLPQIRYSYAKVRISDGIEHALGLLQKSSEFNWTHDELSGIYYID